MPRHDTGRGYRKKGLFEAVAKGKKAENKDTGKVCGHIKVVRPRINQKLFSNAQKEASPNRKPGGGAGAEAEKGRAEDLIYGGRTERRAARV